MASEKIIKQKEAEIKELAEQFKSDKLILLVDYRGINVERLIHFLHLSLMLFL